MLISDMPPVPPNHAPVLMAQTDVSSRGVVMQDLTPLPSHDPVALARPDPVASQGVISYTQTLIEGEELMFIMDVPYIPAQETPIVLAQSAAPAGSTPQPDYILNYCKETESTGDPRSAMRAVDPAGMLAVYLEGRDNKLVDLSAIKNVTMLEGTKHGKIFAWTDDEGLVSFHYDPTPDYIGNDQAIFQAEFEGKRYKIVVELHVFRTVGENDPSASTCPEPQLIKVTKPSTGSSGYDLNSITVTLADLPGGAVGQTTGSNITLDTNAAGHNWFIDPTPADNSEYIPTSNPYEWVAKEGTAAYGKMDMFSVLLHEYGHALGIDHSAANHDYMATTLTPGVRRMPSAEELALMQQLIGQAKATLSPTLSQSERGQDDTPINPSLPIGTTLSAILLGRLRRTDYGSWSPVFDSLSIPAPAPQFEIAANPKLENQARNRGQVLH